MLSSQVFVLLLAPAQDKAYRALPKKACCAASILAVDYIRMRLYIRLKTVANNDMDETGHALNQRQIQSAKNGGSSIDPHGCPIFSSPGAGDLIVCRVLEKTGLIRTWAGGCLLFSQVAPAGRQHGRNSMSARHGIN
ncbi:MAG: hypothetical protein WAV95_04235 [Azonexus sp.]